MFRLRNILSSTSSRIRVASGSGWTHLNYSPRQTSYFSKAQKYVNHLNAIEHLKPASNGLKALVFPFSSGRFLFLNSKSFLRSKEMECECEEEENEPPHKDGSRIFKLLTLYVCLPVILVGSVMIWQHEGKPHKRPEFVPYEYLRIRNRGFPWGDGNHTLFHNPCVNALPDGYEDDEETACHSQKNGDGKDSH